MPFYTWKGINQDGKTIKGITDASSEEALRNTLLNQGIALLEGSSHTRIKSHFYNFLQPRVSNQQLADFFGHLALLVENGVDLATALTIVKDLTNNRTLQNIIEGLIKDISQGQSLNVAAEKYPQTFLPFVTQLLAVGEKTGKLERVLGGLSEHLKQQTALQQQLKQAALMPLVTLAISLLLIWCILFFVMPYFQSLYQSLNSPLPSATSTVLAISRFLHSWLGIACILASFVGLRLLCQIHAIRYMREIFDHAVLFIPVLGPIIIYTDLIMFMQTITIFLASGIPLSIALEQTEKTAKNSLFKSQIKQVMQDILEGNTLSNALIKSKNYFFDAQLAALVRVGEHTGLLGPVLEKASTVYQRRLSAALHTITTIFSPLLIIFIGLCIGGLMVIMYLPILGLGNLFVP